MSIAELKGQAIAVQVSLVATHKTIMELAEHDLAYDGSLLTRADGLGGQIRTADRKYTAGNVAETSHGKTTLLIAMTGLEGDAILSTDDDPDTVCSTILSYREEGMPEAEVFYRGRPEGVPMSWAKAKVFTSHVHLAAEGRTASDDIEEVRLYVESDLLLGMDLNDLPGTGSRHWKDTVLTQRKMTELDDILWIVGDEEPSIESKTDLGQLRAAGLSVVPILNVFEDPTRKPPIERDDDLVHELDEKISNEYRAFFRTGFERPIHISARMIQLERAKPNPDPRVLEDAGYFRLLEVLADLKADAESDRGNRFTRVARATRSIIEQTLATLQDVDEAIEAERYRLGREEQAQDHRDDEVVDTDLEVRARVRTLARAMAQKLCDHVGDQAVLFVEDQLQLSNLGALNTLFNKGSDALTEEMQRRFMEEYLELTPEGEPDWLNELARSYAEDVLTVALPEWRRVWRRAMAAEAEAGGPPRPDLNFDNIAQQLIGALVTMVMRAVGLFGVAALLAAVPGGAIVDAVALAALAIYSTVRDPLEKPRQRAARRARLQTDALRFQVENAIFDAGVETSNGIKRTVIDHFTSERTALRRTMESLRDAHVEIQTTRAQVDAFGIWLTNEQGGV